LVLGRPAARTAALAAALAIGAVCGGCAPWPGTRYVAVVPPGELVHSSCAFNEHVPVGVRMPVGAATALVTVAEHRGRPYLELRLDVPPGTTLRFEADTLEVVAWRGARAGRGGPRGASGVGAAGPADATARAAGPGVTGTGLDPGSGATHATTARFPRISLVDSPIRHLDEAVSADVRARQMAADAPMTGDLGVPVAGLPQPARSHRHYWLAATLDLAGAEAFEVRLPLLVEDGRVTHRLRAVFEARTVVAVALFNC